MSEVADFALRFRRRGRGLVRVRTGRFAADHPAKYDAFPLDKPCGVRKLDPVEIRQLHRRTEFAHPTPAGSTGSPQIANETARLSFASEPARQTLYKSKV